MMRLSLLACAVLAVSSASLTPYPPTNKPVQRSSNLQGRRTSRSGQHSSAKLIEGSEDTTESYSKHQPGRHVCTQEQAVTEPVRSRESYCRPVYKTLPCENGKMCRRYRLVYETAYRDVLKMRVSRKTAFSCCPGWAQGSKVNHGCTKAVCSRSCENGGACLKPEFCGCRPGFTGKHCEIDVDECSHQHSCEHVCDNTVGSYQCTCRDGYTLEADGRSCTGPPVVVSSTQSPEGSRDREELEDDDDEERDFSVEYINLTKRISKLEKIMSKPHSESSVSSVSLNDVTAKLDKVLESISVLKTRVDRMERRVDHHHRALRKNSEDNKLQSIVHKLALLDHRMDRCACTSDSANKINV